MIVTCEECSTSFQLDEARIPASGARVRCSRCKHAFFLPHPSAGDAQALHAIAEAAATDAAPGVPRADAELSSGAEAKTNQGPARGAEAIATRGSAPGAEAIAAPGPAPGADSDPTAASASVAEPEEEDWQFSEEVRVEGDDLDDELEQALADGRSPRAGAEEESAFGVVEDFGTDFPGFDSAQDEADAAALGGPEIDRLAAGDVGADSGLSLDSDAVAPARDGSGFGSVDDFSSLIGDEDFGLAGGAADSGPLASSTPLTSDPDVADDLGDPESWDLLGGEPDRAPRSSLFGVAAPSARAGAEAETFFDADPEPIVYRDEEAGHAGWLRALGLLGQAIGWGVTLTSLAVVLWLALRPEWTRWVQAPQTVSNGALTAGTDAAIWLETSRAGLLLVVEGELRNDGARDQRPGRVQLALLDAEGRRLSAPPIAAGAALPPETLREAPPEVLAERRREAVDRFAARPLAAGEARPFQVVIPESALPEDARRLLLELAGPVAARPAAASRAPAPSEGGPLASREGASRAGASQLPLEPPPLP